MKRFHKGGWKASDVEEVLAYGLETIEPVELDTLARTLEDIEASRARFFGRTYTPRPKFTHVKGDVLGPIMRDGHAAYAPLAEAIIRAALFGILPEEADFDTYTEAANA